jgi:hypothetical protein
MIIRLIGAPFACALVFLCAGPTLATAQSTNLPYTFYDRYTPGVHQAKPQGNKEGRVHIRAVPEGGGAGVRAKNPTSGGGTGKLKALNDPPRGGQGIDFPGRR